MTIGPQGPVPLQDYVFLDDLAHFDRERIPERVVHAKGAGGLVSPPQQSCSDQHFFLFFLLGLLWQAPLATLKSRMTLPGFARPKRSVRLASGLLLLFASRQLVGAK